MTGRFPSGPGSRALAICFAADDARNRSIGHAKQGGYLNGRYSGFGDLAHYFNLPVAKFCVARASANLSRAVPDLMRFILSRANPAKIGKRSVFSAAVQVRAVKAFWAWADKGFQHKQVNRGRPTRTAELQANAWIAVSPEGSENDSISHAPHPSFGGYFVGPFKALYVSPNLHRSNF